MCSSDAFPTRTMLEDAPIAESCPRRDMAAPNVSRQHIQVASAPAPILLSQRAERSMSARLALHSFVGVHVLWHRYGGWFPPSVQHRRGSHCPVLLASMSCETHSANFAYSGANIACTPHHGSAIIPPSLNSQNRSKIAYSPWQLAPSVHATTSLMVGGRPHTCIGGHSGCQ